MVVDSKSAFYARGPRGRNSTRKRNSLCKKNSLRKKMMQHRERRWRQKGETCCEPVAVEEEGERNLLSNSHLAEEVPRARELSRERGRLEKG